MHLSNTQGFSETELSRIPPVPTESLARETCDVLTNENFDEPCHLHREYRAFQNQDDMKCAECDESDFFINTAP